MVMYLPGIENGVVFMLSSMTEFTHLLMINAQNATTTRENTYTTRCRLTVHNALWITLTKRFGHSAIFLIPAHPDRRDDTL